MRVQLSVLREEGGDAAGVVGELLGFFVGEGAVEDGLLAVAEPFLRTW
jgi:hypothetical protein